jgi:hypothetical protein
VKAATAEEPDALDAKTLIKRVRGNAVETGKFYK